MLVFDKVTKSFESKKSVKKVFDDVTFTFPQGRNIGIIGYPNSGKSTLVKLLNGTIYPTSGKIITDEKISWPLGTKNFIKSELTGRQNVYVIAKILGYNNEQSSEKAELVKNLAELEAEFNEPVKTYSNSSKSKMAVALTLCFDFDTYLIDDSSTLKENLKDKLEEELQRKLQNGSRIIFATHEAKSTKKLCNYFVIIKNSKLYGYESYDDALAFYNNEKLAA